MELAREYDAKAVEEKWLRSWSAEMYAFDRDSEKPRFVIDTPPPYPTGDFHIGNALNWCYIDFVARFRRMQGFNVMFPQGWDCHGLPTEVKVEESYGITKNQVSRGEFRRLCVELTRENIRKMEESLRRLGFSIDWTNEYITMEPSYYRKTQVSFVRMYRQGLIYQAEHPVNWCPRCETAIAFAEVEYDSRKTTLNYFHFDSMDIATTRPELLAACVAVAVNPEDERFRDKVGSRLRVPLFGHEVEVIEDPEVDPDFGTGAVMICTFGDKQDVRWWAKYGLQLRKAVDKKGRMLAPGYEGMTIEECRRAIIEDLRQGGLLYRQEEVDQNVGLCWRCKTPIEILSERQWFVKINPSEIMETSGEIKWIPSHMETRLKNWTGTMEWDWCISRQRVFATPIPVWYCQKCGRTKVAEEKWLPLDPLERQPPVACECGSTDFEGEGDVLDTWMDSSISAMHISGWPEQGDTRLPCQLRPQGHDIIRTWAFYTILRTKALAGVKPWETILINGMVLGEDGHKMSKSRNNFVVPEEVTGRYGADAFRHWAALGGATGSDVMFRWKDVVAGSRFLQKLWNITRFSLLNLQGYQHREFDKTELSTVDRWLLSRLHRLIQDTTARLENYQFDEALKGLRSFTWEVLADNYIELVKSRLYTQGDQRARYTLYTTLDTLVRMLAPFLPYITEEIYHHLARESVHLQEWPRVEKELIDPAVEEEGELIKEIVKEVRHYKSQHGIPLNQPLTRIELYHTGLKDPLDIQGATSTPTEIRRGDPDFQEVPVALKPNLGVIGPRYKKKARDIIKALEELNPAKARDGVKLTIEGEEVEIPPECYHLEKEVRSQGRKVEVLEVKKGIVVVTP